MLKCGGMGTGLSTEAEQQHQEDQQVSDEGQARSQSSMPSALVVCGPSGVGKGTLIEKLSKQSDRFGFSCSHTSRTPRPGEEVTSVLFSNRRRHLEMFLKIINIARMCPDRRVVGAF